VENGKWKMNATLQTSEAKSSIRSSSRAASAQIQPSTIHAIGAAE
jgi:hypothetical protein